MLVFDLLFILFRTSLWPSAGKELPLLAFHLCCFNFSAVLVVRVLFPLGVWDRMWNLIVSVPDHCLFLSTFHTVPWDTGLLKNIPL